MTSKLWPLGAHYSGDGLCTFLVWAPAAQRVELLRLGPPERRVPLQRGERGYHHAACDDVLPGELYALIPDGHPPRPDPASRFQPRGVHGPSAVVDPEFAWTDARWRPPPLERMVFYEIHVGTFTPEGTFQAVIPHLPRLAELGVTAVELMPVGQFPGTRNWGYDGVAVYAVQDSYGGPDGLKRLVDACHSAGLAAFLDVVYNHLGPEGNYLAEFGPYFTNRYRTAWGRALNFDGPGSDEVRRFFVENARRWVAEFHFDGLRIDAVHAIRDHSARPFLAELTAAVHDESARAGRPALVIAESDSNDSRLIRPAGQRGIGMDAQWSEDFHHALHALATGERNGYYQDFGRAGDLAAAFTGGYVYTGQPSAYRGRRHGSSVEGVPGERFVVFSQNHDEVGNRARGERLAALTDFERAKVAAAAVILAPYLPLLFMGEEYGERSPFLYFISHGDPRLAEQVRRGRREEFARFAWEGEVPDPQSEETFRRSRLDHALAERPGHRDLLVFYTELLRLRRETEALARPRRDRATAFAFEPERAIAALRSAADGSSALIVLAMGGGPAQLRLPLPSGAFSRALDSAQSRWGGPGVSFPRKICPSAGQASLCFSGPAAGLFLNPGVPPPP